MKSAGMRGYAASLILFVVITVAATFGLRVVESAYGIGGGAVQWHQFGPLIGAAVTSLVVPATSRPDPPRAVARKQWIAHTILGVVAAGLFALLVWIGFTAAQVPGVDLSRAGAGTVAIAMLGGLLGAAAQEVGWRGFLQPTLESRMPRVGSAVIVGLVWTLWYVNAYTDILTGVLLFATYVPLSILLGYLGNGSVVQRVLTTALVHWLITLPVTFFAGFSGFAVQAVVAAATIVVTALFMVMFVVATRRRRARASLGGEAVQGANEEDEAPEQTTLNDAEAAVAERVVSDNGGDTPPANDGR